MFFDIGKLFGKTGESVRRCREEEVEVYRDKGSLASLMEVDLRSNQNFWSWEKEDILAIQKSTKKEIVAIYSPISLSRPRCIESL